MKSLKFLFSLSTTLLILLLASTRISYAEPTMAFGYLVNKSGNADYQYLEKIFPNTFANSIQNIFVVKVIKPNQINRIFKKEGKILEKDYRHNEIIGIVNKLSADYFIYGNFVLLPGDRIKINLNLYSRKINKLFRFTSVGKMETEIFKLVDRITKIMTEVLSKTAFYMTKKIPPGQKLGIITNLDGNILNDLYLHFFSKGYKISGIQGNYVHNLVDDEFIDKFKYITARENSFDLTSDKRTFQFLFGTWAGLTYRKRVDQYKRLYKAYDNDYFNTKFKSLDMFYKKFNVKNLLIIGFNKRKTRAWVRCLDLGDRELVWMESNIKGNFSSILEKITDRMKYMAQIPQKKIKIKKIEKNKKVK